MEKANEKKILTQKNYGKHNNSKVIQNNLGITLVALVVTIIVLLILARS